MANRTTLNAHDLWLVKSGVRDVKSGGDRAVYQWAGIGFKEHWADSITLKLVTGREGSVTTEWVFALKCAVYAELEIETMAPPEHVAREENVAALAMAIVAEEPSIAGLRVGDRVKWREPPTVALSFSVGVVTQVHNEFIVYVRWPGMAPTHMRCSELVAAPREAVSP